MKKSILFILVILSFSLQGQVKLESSIDESFDGSSWTKIAGSDFEYDINKNLIAQTNYMWDGLSWQNIYKTTYSYSISNKITEEIEMYWDGVSQYEYGEKAVYSYNSAGMVTEIKYMESMGTQWLDSYKQTLTYNGTKISLIEYSEYDGSQWVTMGRFTPTYTGNNLTEILIEEFDGTQWESEDKYVLTYDSNNKIISTAYAFFDGSNWVEYEVTNYEVDANFNRIRELLTYDGYPDSKVEYTYDLTVQLSSIAHPFGSKNGLDYIIEDFPFFNKVLTKTYFYYNDFSDDYDQSERTTYNYSNHIVLSTENIQKTPKISLYPNPANDFIQIKGITKPENVSVYTVLGVKAFDAILKENDKLNIQKLNNGLYLLKFENGTAFKFLKK